MKSNTHAAALVSGRIFSACLLMLLLSFSLAHSQAAPKPRPDEQSLLDTAGNLVRAVPAAEVAAWKQALHNPRTEKTLAAWAHLHLGEWELLANQQPERADFHFAQIRARVSASERVYGLAAFDHAVALEHEGAYKQSTAAFKSLLTDRPALNGLNLRQCAIWYRHSAACATYHAERSAMGIPEPPRLDPHCAAAGLAIALRGLHLPYDKPHVLANIRVTGEGSTMQDVIDAGKKLQVAVHVVQADEEGLRALPMPVIAYVEHDHFIAVTKADKKGVTYYCSDCGAWPGGEVNLSWQQWKGMNAGLYAVVTRPNSLDDRMLTGMKTTTAIQQTSNPVLFGSTGKYCGPPLSALAQAALLKHVVISTMGNGNFYCGTRPNTNPCNGATCCPMDGAGASGGGDPVNLATGEEQYQPTDDLTVYNPTGPAVRWGRLYNSLRVLGDGYSYGDKTYQSNDFGAGWSQHYNVGVYDPNPGGASGTKYILLENGARIGFTAPAVPTAAAPRVACTVDPGNPMLVEWDYDASSTAGYFTLTFADRTQWITGGKNTANCFVLAQIKDRMGNAIYLNYTPALSGYNWPLLSSISTGANATGTILLTVQRTTDGSGNIVSVSDNNGRSVYYRCGYYKNLNIPGGYQQGYYELATASQIVPTGTQNPPARYNYGYQLVSNREGAEQVVFLHTITVPSPTGAGSSTDTINYDPATTFVASIVDANGNAHVYTSVDGLHTKVTVRDLQGNVAYSYTAGYIANMSATTQTDGAGNIVSTKTFDANSANPMRPSSITDSSGNTAYYTWDKFGNKLTDKRAAPRNTVTTFTYDYSQFPLGELVSVQQGAKSPTTYAYFEPSGLIKKITRPAPNSVGTAATVTASFTYNPLGNVLTVTAPGNDATTASVTTFNYGANPAIDEPLTVSDSAGKTSSFGYDVYGNIVTQTDASGKSTTHAYNIANQLTATVLSDTQVPTHRPRSPFETLHTVVTTNYTYPGGQPTSRVTNVNGQAVRTVTLSYGPNGELLSETGSTEPTVYTYDALYRVKSLSDGRGGKTSYAYNAQGYLAGVTFPGGASAQYPEYNALGQVTKRIDGRGITTVYQYSDPDNLLTDIKYTGYAAQNVHIAYDGYGRRSSITDASGMQTFQYDDDDHLTGVTTQYTGLPARTIGYAYYPNGSRQTMTTPAGNFTCQYLSSGLLKTLTNPFSEKTNWTYLDNGQVSKVTLGNGVSSTYTYDARNQIATIASAGGGGLAGFNGLYYDGTGNQTQQAAYGSSIQGVTNYTYDSKDQLTQEQSTQAGGFKNAFAYDPAGNPTTFRNTSGLTYNNDNQNTAANYTYDGEGSPTTYQGATLTYDVENRLTGIGSPAFSAVYNGDGLRTMKQAGGVTTYFLYDGTFPVCELDASGNVQAVNSMAGGRVVSRHTSAGSTFYTFDPQGNVAQRLSGTGGEITASVYDAFGTPKNGGVSDPFGYGGQMGCYTDSETGLIYMVNRYYDPGTGRFLTRDPASYASGINVYAYVQNNAVNYGDASGLGWGRTIGGFVGGVGGAIAGSAFGPVGTVIGGGLGTGLGSFLGSLFDGDCVGDAALNGLTDGAIALVTGAAFEGASSLLGGLARGGCFVAGTPVAMADGSFKPIEQIQAGDRVLSRSQDSEARGKVEAKQVTQTETHWKPTLVLTFDDGTHIETTGEHPFRIQDKGFVPAGRLSLGNAIVTRAGPCATLVKTEWRSTAQTVYNFTVADDHTYFVGRQNGGLWVHNSCFTPDQAALVDLAKQAQRKGVSAEEAQTLRQWADEVGLPSRGPEAHPGRPFGQYPHIHIGPVNHIPVR